MSLVRMDNQGKLLRTASANRLVRMDNHGKLIGGPLHSPKPAPQVFRSALLLLDVSPSMADQNKFTYAKQGAMRFAVSAMDKKYHSGLIAFGAEARLIAEPSGNLDAFKKVIDSTSVGMLGGGTNIAKALFLVSTISNISAAVLVTDGEPTCPHEEALHYAAGLRERGVDLICIGTEDADRKFLKRIATRQDLAIHTNDKNIQNAISDASRLLAC